MRSCGYTISGALQGLAVQSLPPIDDPKAIETHHFEDQYALGDLQRHVNAIRATPSLPLYTDYDYRAAKLMTLEELYLQSTETTDD